MLKPPLLLAVVLCGAIGCGEAATTSPAPSTAVPPAVEDTAPSSAGDGGVESAGSIPSSAPVVTVSYRVERRTSDPGTASFREVVEDTLSDPRGWGRAGFRLLPRADAPYVVVLADAQEVDRLCLPYDTYGLYSCQNGPVVALNADRWRTATPEWTGDLATYRLMLVNHEVGHLLGQRHPAMQCPEPGRPAAVMAQQSTELRGCRANPWPLDWEIALAARHHQPLAPPFEP